VVGRPGETGCTTAGAGSTGSRPRWGASARRSRRGARCSDGVVLVGGDLDGGILGSSDDG
jgi:hypothetical protein